MASWVRRYESSLWLAGVVAAGLICLWAGDQNGRVSAALVAATLVAILWYTAETRRTRISQDEAKASALLAEELRAHPWLEATTLRPDIRRPGREGQPPEIVLYLPVINRGIAPARDMRFAGGLVVAYPRGPGLGGTSSRDEESSRVFLAPSDVAHVHLGSLPLLDADANVQASARIRYGTLPGGRGMIEVTFQGEIRGFEIRSFSNGPMRYVVVDSAGRQHGDV
jgi:hypothetical protein